MTRMVWLQRLKFVEESCARQVRVALKVWPQKPVVFVEVETIETVIFVPSQISTAAGVVKLQGNPHSTISASGQMIRGGVVSTKVIV